MEGLVVDVPVVDGGRGRFFSLLSVVGTGLNVPGGGLAGSCDPCWPMKSSASFLDPKLLYLALLYPFTCSFQRVIGKKGKETNGITCHIQRRSDKECIVSKNQPKTNAPVLNTPAFHTLPKN